jgi:hypothetical protein
MTRTDTDQRPDRLLRLLRLTKLLLAVVASALSIARLLGAL